MQKLLPAVVQVRHSPEGLEGLPNDIVWTHHRGAKQSRQNFNLSQATKQRLEERLHRHVGTIRTANITPGFEVVCSG